MQPDPVYIFYIGATPEKVWEALTGAEGVRKMFFGARLETTFEPGSSYRYVGSNGKGSEQVYLAGTILECDPPRLLRTSYSPGGERFTSELAYELEPIAACTKLTLRLVGLHDDDPTRQHSVDGTWKLLSRLKSMIETGEPLNLWG
jgi:uncharacterized protein YndB with AHSA1/START domain